MREGGREGGEVATYSKPTDDREEERRKEGRSERKTRQFRFSARSSLSTSLNETSVELETYLGSIAVRRRTHKCQEADIGPRA